MRIVISFCVGERLTDYEELHSIELTHRLRLWIMYIILIKE